jgi:hypothetical protein
MHLLGKRTLSRRTLLRGAGVAMSLPLLEAMMDRPAHAAPPVRLLVYFWPHGTRGSAWSPSVTGPMTAADLSPATQVFKPSAGKIDLVPHLTFLTGVGDIHRQALASHQASMTATAEGDGNGRGDSGTLPTIASIDQVLAMKLGGSTALPSLAVSAASNPRYNTARVVLSYRGPNQPVTPYLRPVQVYELLFSGSSKPPTGSPDSVTNVLARDKSVLDVVSGDAKRLRTRIGKGDQRRLEDYEQALREIERGLQSLPSGPTAAPGASSSSCRGGDAGSWGPATAQAGSEAGPVEGLLLKLLVLAFRCDRTRYATYMLEFSLGGKRWSSQGSPMGDHDLSHANNGGHPNVVPRTNIKLSYLADAMREMAAIDEGGTSLLHNTIIYANSENFDGNGHSRNPHMPILIGGHAGGRLRGGRHLRFTPARSLNDLFASLLTYAGLPTEKWGQRGTGTLPGF